MGRLQRKRYERTYSSRTRASSPVLDEYVLSYLADFYLRVEGGLTTWDHGGIDDGKGRDGKDGVAVGDAVNAGPAVTHPDDAGRHIVGYTCPGREASSLVVDLDGIVWSDLALLRVKWVYP